MKVILPAPKIKRRVGFDLDETLGTAFAVWVKKIGEALDPAMALSEADFTSWATPAHLKGKKIRAGILLRKGRITTGTECLDEGQGPNGIVTRPEFLTPDIYNEFKTFPDAPEAVARVASNRWIEAVCVTAHPDGVSDLPADRERVALEGQKSAIIDRDFPALKGKIIFERRKEKCGLFILIDDSPKNIEAVQAAGGIGILINRNWNRNADLGNVIRVNSVVEAVPHIERLVKERTERLFRYTRALSQSRKGRTGSEPITR